MSARALTNRERGQLAAWLLLPDGGVACPFQEDYQHTEYTSFTETKCMQLCKREFNTRILIRKVSPKRRCACPCEIFTQSYVRDRVQQLLKKGE